MEKCGEHLSSEDSLIIERPNTDGYVPARNFPMAMTSSSLSAGGGRGCWVVPAGEPLLLNFLRLPKSSRKALA
jgi:hypothetical protein